MIVLREGSTELKGCRFDNCKLILKENAFTVGKILQVFTGKGPVKVVDFDEKGMFSPQDET